MSSGVESEKRKAQANLSKLTRFLSSKRQDEQYAELLEKFNNFMIFMDLDSASGDRSCSQNGFPRLDNHRNCAKQARSFPKPSPKRGRLSKMEKEEIVPFLSELCSDSVSRPINDHCWPQVLAADSSKIFKYVEAFDKSSAEEFFS